MRRGDRRVTLIEQYQTTYNPAAGNCSGNHKFNPKQKGNRDVDQLSHVDHVTTNAHSSQGESQFYIIEDNEAVIKMIIKGRRPTMRHKKKSDPNRKQSAMSKRGQEGTSEESSPIAKSSS